MQTIRRFSNSAEASFCRSVLEAAGIEAVLAEENAFALGPQFAPWGIRLQVQEESVEAAKAILDRQEGFEALPEDFVPPAGPAEDDEVPPPRPTSAGKAFVVGGVWAVIIVAAVLILARVTGARAYADGGGLFLVFATGGVTGLIVRAIYRRGARDGSRGA